MKIQVKSKIIRVLPCTYNGVAMRSRSEARFAAWLDDHDQPWIYEPEGYGDGVDGWIPDFYLPRSKLLVEVKPAVFIHEIKKIKMILKDPAFAEIEILVVEMINRIPNFLRFAEAYGDIGEIFSEEAEGVSFNPELRYFGSLDCGPSGFCNSCGALNFSGCGGWGCNGCGYYNGDNTTATFERGTAYLDGEPV